MATAASLREAEVIWRPNPGQQEKFHRAKEFEVLYGGARGGGKTDSLLMEATRQVWHPHYRGILFRRELKRAEDMIERSLKLYKKAFPGAKFNANEAKWYFPSGATIQFGHLQHEHNKYDYIGREFQYIAFDQLEEFTQTQYLFLMGSCRTSHPELRCYIRASANPGGPGHNWVKQRFITPAPPETTIIDPVSGRTRKFIPAGPYDNPKLDPSYLQSLKMLPEKLQKAWIEGDWDTFQGQYFEEWDPEIHVLKEHFEPPPEWPRYHALDWGSDKPYAYGLFTFLKGKPYLFAELYGWSGEPNVGTKETADRVAEKILELQKRHNALGCIGPADTQIWNKSGEVGPTIQQTFQEYGITFVKATKDRLNGWERCRQALQTDRNGEPGFYVSPRCVHFIRTIPSLQHDEHRPEDLDTNGEDHAADMWRYFMMFNPQTATNVYVPGQRRNEVYRLITPDGTELMFEKPSPGSEWWEW